MQTKVMERYFFFGLLLATILFTFMIFRPFWIVFVLGISFSIILHPIYAWLVKHKLPDWCAALLTILFFIIVLCGPMLGIGTIVFNQSQDLYRSVVITNSAGTFLASVGDHINTILPVGFNFDINAKVAEFISLILSNTAQIFSATFSTLFSFFLVLLIIFHFLKDGTRWKKALILLSPLAENKDEQIMSRLGMAVNGVMKGYILIALLQGLLMGIGLSIFGVPHPALWGVLAFVTALIPMVSTFPISIPSIIFLFITGNTGHAIGLLIWTILMVAIIDNFLSPMFISKKINIPSLLILFSVLGGITLFGPVGILIGPLTVSLLYALISIYRNEFKQS